MLNRRAFLSGILASRVAAQTKVVTVQVQPGKRGSRIPSDFMGLGYEVSSVSERGLLTADNRPYVQLVRRPSSAGL